jgi:AGCS family alanine or glycine:cation symporter
MSHLLSNRTRRRSLLLALAGTLGVGNIYGVALGIMIGGEGSVFWLFVSSFFAMAVKYSESVVAVSDNSHGRGMMISIERTFGRVGKTVATIYSIAMLFLSLFMGGFIQSDSFISSVAYLFPINEMVIAMLFIFLVIFVILGGREGIKSATESLIPIATVVYVAISLIIIIKDASRLSCVVSRITTSALTPTSMIFGVIPVVSYSAVSQGFARGLLSNEAGTGSSAMAHSEGNSNASDAGLFGILEIIFDTNLLCIITALVILCEVENPAIAPSPMSLVFSAFKSGAGVWSLLPLLFCITLFAYSTVICWYYYGIRALAYLSLDRSAIVYSIAFCLFLFAPSIFHGVSAVYVSDFLLFLMSIPTLSCILINRKNIELTTTISGLIDKK